MKLKHLGYLLLLICRISYGQNNNQIKSLAAQGQQYEQSGDNVKAFNSYLAVFNLDKTNYNAITRMAAISGKIGDTRTQIVWAQKAIMLDPKLPDGFINLGNAYAAQKNYADAEVNYQKVIAIDHNNLQALYSLGLLEAIKGHFTEAIKYYKRVIALDDNYDIVPYQMAFAYDQLHDYTNAYEIIDHYRAINDTSEVLTLWRRVMAEISAQPFTYPVIAGSGTSLNNFVPAGWRIKGKTQGDLNGDKIPDEAVVLEYDQMALEIRDGNDSIYSHPRILLVLLKSGNIFKKIIQQNTFILRACEGDGMSGDPFDKIEISNGVLSINYEYTRSHLYYMVSYRQNDFYLTAATNAGVDHNIMFSWDFNFLTREIIHNEGESTDPADKHAKNKLEKRTIPITRPKKITELSKPYAWEVVKGVFI